MFPKTAYISDAMRVASTLSRRGDKRPDDVELGAPTLVLNSAAHCGLTTPQLQQNQAPTDHTDPITFAHSRRAATIMADNPKPARTIPATSDDFRRAAQLAGTKLRERLPEDSEYATHFPGFDSYNAKHYQAILGELMEKFKNNVCSHGLARFM
jgi:hypothetical protein